METNKLDFKNMSLKDIGDLSKLKAKDFELAASLFSKSKGPEIVSAVVASSNEIAALVKIVVIITPVIIEAGKTVVKKEKEYLDQKYKELQEIQEKCKDPDLTNDEKYALAQQEAEIILGLQKRNAFKKWAKVAGIVFLVPFPFNLVYALNKNKKKKKELANSNSDDIKEIENKENPLQ